MPISTQVIAIIIFFSPIFLPTYTMEMENKEKSNFYSIYLPGKNGGGGSSFKENGLINIDNHKAYRTIGYTSPKQKKYLEIFKMDLAQENCVKHFEKQLLDDKEAQDKILLLSATSQGTGTLINFLARQSKELQDRVGYLTLESVLSKGNSAIMQTVEHYMFKDSIFEILKYGTYLPAARLLIPWLAKCAFITYNPLGTQAISSAKKLPKDLLIIIMHHVNDPQISINDARELYCTLCESGNKCTYLFECNNEQKIHSNILNSESPAEKIKKVGAIQAIYKHHGFEHNEQLLQQAIALTTLNINEFKPSIEEVKKKINASSWKTRYLRNTIDAITLSALIIYLACYPNSCTLF